MKSVAFGFLLFFTLPLAGASSDSDTLKQWWEGEETDAGHPYVANVTPPRVQVPELCLLPSCQEQKEILESFITRSLFASQQVSVGSKDDFEVDSEAKIDNLEG